MTNYFLLGRSPKSRRLLMLTLSRWILTKKLLDTSPGCGARSDHPDRSCWAEITPRNYCVSPAETLVGGVSRVFFHRRSSSFLQSEDKSSSDLN